MVRMNTDGTHANLGCDDSDPTMKEAIAALLKTKSVDAGLSGTADNISYRCDDLGNKSGCSYDVEEGGVKDVAGIYVYFYIYRISSYTKASLCSSRCKEELLSCCLLW